MSKTSLIVVVGPTASGKTDLAINLAKTVQGEIVSADSMQIYKDMPIASAVPSDEEKQGIPHHLMEFLSPTDRFTVVDYKAEATSVIKDIVTRNKTPILVGGTGLYIDAVVDNITYKEEENSKEVRIKLEKMADINGMDHMLEMLAKIDKQTADKLHANDRKRIIRALEVFEIHGKTMSELKELSRALPSPYDAVVIGLRYKDRSKLYAKINKRVDIMLRNGLLDEAKSAYMSVDRYTSAQAIGHKEFFEYFEGKISLEAAVESLKIQTRHYAKRQMTWFLKNTQINWINVDEEQDVFKSAEEILKNSNLL
ncbi:MAG: tRNA (adenosine(37)-N6)-dimethylallyltransferase MiaA [Oscillospiraceae bacterium]|nr:tRNA (adenosine(37)-N6)-dimethylallyltransferase MiaA [Oscillospiraceae bacterium]